MDSRTALIAIARYARGQWGMVTSAQAVAAGVSYMQIKRMTEAGLLDKAGPGVYLMIGGQAAAERNRAHKVAWLRLDPAVPGWERPLLGPNSAIVSHSSAAVLLRLGDLVVRDIEFTTTRRRTSRDPAVRLHRATLAPYEVTWADGLPVTTAIRTLADLLATGIAASHAWQFPGRGAGPPDAQRRHRHHGAGALRPPVRMPVRRRAGPGGDAARPGPGRDRPMAREQTVADLARELLKLSEGQLRSLHSLASAAQEPAIAALLSRLAPAVRRDARPRPARRGGAAG